MDFRAASAGKGGAGTLQAESSVNSRVDACCRCNLDRSSSKVGGFVEGEEEITKEARQVHTQSSEKGKTKEKKIQPKKPLGMA